MDAATRRHHCRAYPLWNSRRFPCRGRPIPAMGAAVWAVVVAVAVAVGAAEAAVVVAAAARR